MINTLTFSETYLKVLTLIGKANLKSDKDKKNSALFFKNDERTRLTIMGKQSLIHISSPFSHANFVGDEIGIDDTQQFIRYCKAVNYPKNGSNIFHGEEKSTRGRKYETLTFTNNKSTFKTVVASPTIFDPNYDRKIPTPSEKDPLTLGAKIILTPEHIKSIGTARSLMGNDAASFCLSIEDNKLSFYMAGSLPGNQAQIEFDNLSYVVYSVFDTKLKDSGKFKLFSLQFLESLQLFPIDFTCEVRVYEAGGNQTLVLKAYGEIIEGNDEPIKIIVACQEAEAAVIANNFDLII